MAPKEGLRAVATQDTGSRARHLTPHRFLQDYRAGPLGRPGHRHRSERVTRAGLDPAGATVRVDLVVVAGRTRLVGPS